MFEIQLHQLPERIQISDPIVISIDDASKAWKKSVPVIVVFNFLFPSFFRSFVENSVHV